MPQENSVKLDITEALRYLGIPKEKQDAALLESARDVAERVRKAVTPRWLYRVYAVTPAEQGMMLTVPLAGGTAAAGRNPAPGGVLASGGTSAAAASSVTGLAAGNSAAAASSQTGLLLPGNSAAVMLKECSHAVLLIASLGAGFDALLRREQAQDMSRAVIMDACGSAFVEGACDRAEEELAARFPGKYLTDRFSPGYGDLPLGLQESLCRELDAYRRLGIAVSESMLMNPVKSVTAEIGISDRPQQARIRGCEYCSMKETCAFRKRGERCVS